MKKAKRILAVAAASVLTVVSLAMFAGCDTDNPEVRITYSFNGVEYKVDYRLSRKGAPATVQHFIELADNGYYDGTIIHDYQSNAIYGGAYTWDADNEEMVEKDYYNTVKDWNLTQTVFQQGEDGKPGKALYTVRGEFENNGIEGNSKTLTHSQGALAMYYTSKGNDSTRVGMTRADGGKDNDGSEYQEDNFYRYNSATSMFYTITGTSSQSSLNASYCVFGDVIDFRADGGMRDLLDAIQDYIDELDNEDDFTESTVISNVNRYDPYDAVTGGSHFRNLNISATYQVPVEPITVVSVKVTKY